MKTTFCQNVISFYTCRLRIVFQNLISDSENILFEDVKPAHLDESIRVRMYNNLFHEFYILLADIRETDSQRVSGEGQVQKTETNW